MWPHLPWSMEAKKCLSSLSSYHSSDSHCGPCPWHSPSRHNPMASYWSHLWLCLSSSPERPGMNAFGSPGSRPWDGVWCAGCLLRSSLGIDTHGQRDMSGCDVCPKIAFFNPMGSSRVKLKLPQVEHNWLGLYYSTSINHWMWAAMEPQYGGSLQLRQLLNGLIVDVYWQHP